MLIGDLHSQQFSSYPCLRLRACSRSCQMQSKLPLRWPFIKRPESATCSEAKRDASSALFPNELGEMSACERAPDLRAIWSRPGVGPIAHPGHGTLSDAPLTDIVSQPQQLRRQMTRPLDAKHLVCRWVEPPSMQGLRPETRALLVAASAAWDLTHLIKRGSYYSSRRKLRRVRGLV